MTEVETFDQASLEAFIGGLVAAGFEPESGSYGSNWRGPIHPAFDGLTVATRMRILVRDGWPFVFPVALVGGLHSHHLTDGGYVCLWHEGDVSGDWVTTDGFFARVAEWCEEARSGWDARGLGQDAYLNFTNKDAAVATFNLDDLANGSTGAWGDFHGVVQGRFRVDLGPGRGGPEDLSGLWFHVNGVEVPPRNLPELRSALNGAQRKAFDRAVKNRRAVEVLEPSGAVDLVLFRWDRDEVRHLVVLGVSGAGDEVDVAALLEGPNDEASLLLRAGPDARALRTKSAVIFGVGALGGHSAVCLASSGLGRLRLVDPDVVVPGNVVRHVSGHQATGVPKAYAVKVLVADHAPWTEVDTNFTKPRTPSELTSLVEDVDLIIDATGSAGASAALAAIATATEKPLVSAGLYRGGFVARVQRQGTPGDTALGARVDTSLYPPIPPGAEEDDLVDPAVGCSAPINNAPPSSVLACAATITQAAVDVLTGRCGLPDEILDVYRPLVGVVPFDRVGRVLNVKPVLVTEGVIAQLREMAAAAYPDETGGILVGVVARRVPWIVGAIEFAEDRSPGQYTVSKGSTQPAVKRARETIDTRVGYAGEWHSHPGDFGPSATDRAAMRSVSWFVARQPPGGPCLLLVRSTTNGWVVDGYRARFPQLLPVELLATGPLPN